MSAALFTFRSPQKRLDFVRLGRVVVRAIIGENQLSRGFASLLAADAAIDMLASFPRPISNLNFGWIVSKSVFDPQPMPGISHSFSPPLDLL